jgi:hypothetical protein
MMSDCEGVCKGLWWRGMTEEMALASLGDPDRRHTYAYGSSEIETQWVYDFGDYRSDLYLYFQGGVCTSWSY